MQLHYINFFYFVHFVCKNAPVNILIRFSNKKFAFCFEKQFSEIRALRKSSSFPSKHGYNGQTRFHKERALEQNKSHRVLGNYIV